jgi:amidase
MVPIAHGNDAGGSIRIPAAFCGLVGLKPSRGRTSQGPLQGESLGGVAEHGVLTRTVRDAALGLDVVSGNMPGDTFVAPKPNRSFREEVDRSPGRLRIGVVRGAPSDRAPFSQDAEDALKHALTLVEDLGHELRDSHPDGLDEEGLNELWPLNFSSGFAAGMEPIEQALGRSLTADDFEPFTWPIIERGRRISATEYLKYFEWRNDITRRTAQWWADGNDILVVPTTSAVAPQLGEEKLRPGETIDDAFRRMFDFIPFTHLWNATGQPAISLPIHTTGEGLPFGVTFVAAYGREDVLIRLASQIEAASPWKDSLPPLS